MNHCIEILLSVVMTLYIIFNMIVIFKILILPILEHGRSSHILMYSSIFLLECFRVFIVEVFYQLD